MFDLLDTEIHFKIIGGKYIFCMIDFSLRKARFLPRNLQKK